MNIFAEGKGQVPLDQEALGEILVDYLAETEVTLLSWIHHQPVHISGHITDRWLECSQCRAEAPLKCSSCDIPSVLVVPPGLKTVSALLAENL